MSTRCKTSKCLFAFWNDIQYAFQAISDDDNEKSKTKYKALTFKKYFSSLEVCRMHDVFERFDVLNLECCN